MYSTLIRVFFGILSSTPTHAVPLMRIATLKFGFAGMGSVTVHLYSGLNGFKLIWDCHKLAYLLQKPSVHEYGYVILHILLTLSNPILKVLKLALNGIARTAVDLSDPGNCGPNINLGIFEHFIFNRCHCHAERLNFDFIATSYI